MSADVERLADRLARIPPSFLAPVEADKEGGVRVDAVVADLMRERAGHQPQRKEIARLLAPAKVTGVAAHKSERRHLQLVLVASWLLHDTAFQGMSHSALATLLGQRLRALAELVLPRAFVEDAERREELVRTCLHALGMSPGGEVPAISEDRLATLDSVRRHELLRQAREREEEQKRRREELERVRRQEEEERRKAARYTSED